MAMKLGKFKPNKQIKRQVEYLWNSWVKKDGVKHSYLIQLS